MAFRAFFVLAAFAALAGSAQASPIIGDTFSYVGIYYGSAELFSPGGTLLSTSLAMTAETQFVSLGPPADQNAFGAAMAQAMVQGFSNPPNGTPPLPPVFSQDFLSQIPALEDNNGLGNEAPNLVTSTAFDPNNAPTPASDALYTDLTTQPANFAITGDTGFVEYGNVFDYVYVWSAALPVPVETIESGQPACCITTLEGGIDVQFFERDLQLTEIVATPEPRGSWLALVVVMLAWTFRKYLRGIRVRREFSRSITSIALVLSLDFRDALSCEGLDAANTSVRATQPRIQARRFYSLLHR